MPTITQPIMGVRGDARLCNGGALQPRLGVQRPLGQARPDGMADWHSSVPQDKRVPEEEVKRQWPSDHHTTEMSSRQTAPHGGTADALAAPKGALMRR